MVFHSLQDPSILGAVVRKGAEKTLPVRSGVAVGVGGGCVGVGVGGRAVAVGVRVASGGGVAVKTGAAVGVEGSVGANRAVIVRFGVGEKKGVGVLGPGN